MGIFYGLLTALGWGTGDLLVTRASRRVGPLRSLYLTQLFGFLAMIVLVLALGKGPPDFSVAWIWLLLVGVIDFAGMFLLFRSFTIGSLAICSPIAASYAVVTGVLAFATGERPPGLVLAGAVVLVIGMMIVAHGSGGGTSTLAGMPEAFGAALLFGVFYWSMDGITDSMGWLWPVLINRGQKALLGLALLLPRGQASIRAEKGTGRLLITAALLDAGAFASFNLGLQHSFTTTTTALASLYSAVAAVLAWIFLRERLSPAQWTGIAIILAGILLVAL